MGKCWCRLGIDFPCIVVQSGTSIMGPGSNCNVQLQKLKKKILLGDSIVSVFFCDTRFHHDSIYVPGTCQVTMGKRYRASAVRSGVLRAVRSSLTGLFWGTMKVFEGYIYIYTF